MIYELKIKADDYYFRNKCGNCKYFKTDDKLYGECICMENKIKNKYRQYNSKSCIYKCVH